MNIPHILFICSKNQWRSPTAEIIYRHDPRLNVRSTGTNASARKYVSETDLNWADLILVMENKHKKRIRDRYNYLNLPSIIVLDIPDDYRYMNRELISIIETSVEAILADIKSYL